MSTATQETVEVRPHTRRVTRKYPAGATRREYNRAYYERHREQILQRRRERQESRAVSKNPKTPNKTADDSSQ